LTGCEKFTGLAGGGSKKEWRQFDFWMVEDKLYFSWSLFQIAFELLIVSFAKVDLPSLITPRSHMIKCPLIFNAQWSSHEHPLILPCAWGKCPALTLDHITSKMRILKYSLVKERQSQICPMSRPDPIFSFSHRVIACPDWCRCPLVCFFPSSLLRKAGRLCLRASARSYFWQKSR
jgi:hypothetical protein